MKQGRGETLGVEHQVASQCTASESTGRAPRAHGVPRSKQADLSLAAEYGHLLTYVTESTDKYAGVG